MPKDSNALILVFDSLSPRFLGCYGNTWVETPNIDQLAANSVVLENVLASSTNPTKNLAAILSGKHPAQEITSGDRCNVDLLRPSGIHSTLFSDADSESLQPFQALFDDATVVSPPKSSQCCEEFEEAHLAGVFAELIDSVQRQSTPFVCVAYLSSLTQIWDAPYAWREKFADPEDPTPGDFVLPPHSNSEVNLDDPDEILGFAQAYAAQVELLDQCVGVLWQCLSESGMLDQLIVGLTSVRGFPFAEHGSLGHDELLMNSEAVHVPMMIRWPTEDVYPTRKHQVVNEASIMPTICRDLVDMPVELDGCPAIELQQDPPDSAALCVNSAGTNCIWTSDWTLIDHSEGPLLYVKPDDRWEVNPVAEKCPDEVKELREMIRRKQAGDRRLET